MRLEAGRNIPQDLSESMLDPVELFPAIEHFLQSVPPNEWRARATKKYLAEICLWERSKSLYSILLVSQVGSNLFSRSCFPSALCDDVYELLSASFDDPSATIVYPYVYRILNSGTRNATESTIYIYISSYWKWESCGKALCQLHLPGLVDQYLHKELRRQYSPLTVHPVIGPVQARPLHMAKDCILLMLKNPTLMLNYLLSSVHLQWNDRRSS